MQAFISYFLVGSGRFTDPRKDYSGQYLDFSVPYKTPDRTRGAIITSKPREREVTGNLPGPGSYNVTTSSKDIKGILFGKERKDIKPREKTEDVRIDITTDSVNAWRRPKTGYSFSKEARERETLRSYYGNNPGPGEYNSNINAVRERAVSYSISGTKMQVTAISGSGGNNSFIFVDDSGKSRKSTNMQKFSKLGRFDCREENKCTIRHKKTKSCNNKLFIKRNKHLRSMNQERCKEDIRIKIEIAQRTKDRTF